MEVVGDISHSLEQIALRCSREAEPALALQLRGMMDEEAASFAQMDSFPLKPQRILHDVRSVM